MVSVSAAHKISLLYGLAAIMLAINWGIVLFFYDNSGEGSRLNIFYSLINENRLSPSYIWFRWLLATLAFCALLSIAYLTKLAKSYTYSICLLTIGIVLALASWYMADASIAISVSLPLVYGWALLHTIKQANFKKGIT